MNEEIKVVYSTKREFKESQYVYMITSVSKEAFVATALVKKKYSSWRDCGVATFSEYSSAMSWINAMIRVNESSARE